MPSKNPDDMTVNVVVTVTVSQREWMDKYGGYITRNQLVPAVTLEKAVKKAARTGLEKLGLKSLRMNR